MDTAFCRVRLADVHRLLTLIVITAWGQPAYSATWIQRAQLSFDTTQSTAVGAASPRQILTKVYQSTPVISDLGLPSGVDISALATDGADILFVPDTAFEMNGATFTARNIVRRQPNGDLSLALAWQSLTLPTTSAIDAIALSGSLMLFSIDAPADLGGGISAGPSDVLVYNGAQISVLYSRATLSLASTSNLIALDSLPNGHLLVAFDTSGSAGALPYSAGQVIEYDPLSNSWSSANTRVSIVTDSVSAISSIAVIGLIDVVFRSAYENFED